MCEFYCIAHCRDPSYQMDDTIQVFGFSKDSVIPGSRATFTCSPLGYTLVGPNTSLCVSNGEWEPDPREATKCKGEKSAKFPSGRTVH